MQNSYKNNSVKKIFAASKKQFNQLKNLQDRKSWNDRFPGNQVNKEEMPTVKIDFIYASTPRINY